MSKNILLINGHPDAGNEHFCDAIAQKYSSAALAAGHQIECINVNEIEFDLLQSKEDYDTQSPPEAIANVQRAVLEADHLVVVYPLWMGHMPALLKGLFEQLFRRDFAGERLDEAKFRKLFRGRSARIIVTMGMPGYVYKWFFRAHTLKGLKRNILDFIGFKPVKATVIGDVYEGNDKELKLELREISRLGQLAN
jgi:putative NADPH-quinone reductase